MGKIFLTLHFYHIYNLSITINVLVYHDRFTILYQLTKWNHSPLKKEAQDLLMSAE